MEEFFEKLEKLLEKSTNRQQVIVRGGIGPIGLLGIAFVVMKLVGAISWSWWWVLAPFWVPVAFIGFILLFVIILLAIVASKYKPFDLTDNTKTFVDTTTTLSENTQTEENNSAYSTEENIKVENPVVETRTKKPKRSRRTKTNESKSSVRESEDSNRDATEEMSGDHTNN